MKQSLQLKLNQQLVMTPQLQQTIKLLQLSTLDLQQEIQQILDSNPMLEISEEYDADGAGFEGGGADLGGEPGLAGNEGQHTGLNSEPGFGENRPDPEEDTDTLATRESAASEITDLDSSDIPSELPVDTQWDDVYQSPVSQLAPFPEGDFDLENRSDKSETLREHLLWQLNVTRMSDTDLAIAQAIIDATDDRGRLGMAAEDILACLDPTLNIGMKEVTAVLHCLQQFDPAGVCTRDLRECLLVQLRQLSESTPFLDEALVIVNRYMDLIGNRDYSGLMRRSKITEADLKGALALIQSLNPNPGNNFSTDIAAYIVPDVIVSRKNGSWMVELNPDVAPRLRINDQYTRLIKRADNSAENTYMRDNLQEARWFLKSLHSRNETLMKVAIQIVEHQLAFLEHGEEAMKPLVMQEIADELGLHESTVSRVTMQKYMHTPRGIFEFKYFFSSHVGTDSGGECSSIAVRAHIRKLVAAEDPRRPLSDIQITRQLQQQGIKVARRTIAKYRESLLIPPSHERKRLI